MRAKFVGKNGSMGFYNGKIYQIRTDVKTNSKGESFLWVHDVNSKLHCPYSRLETMLENWKIIEESH